MVVMAYPSACTANIRQARTGVPSTSTVRAPHTPCSQPAWAPVSSSSSRRQSSRLVRGSTATVRASPLTVNSTRMRALPGTIGVGDRAHGKARRRAPAIVGRRMQVGQRLDIGERRAHGVAGDRFLRPRADERIGHRIESQRARRYAADAQRDTPADAVVVERDLRRRRGKGEIAPAGIDLMEADADALLAPD